MAELLELIAGLRAANPDVCLAWEPAPLQLTGAPDEMRAALARVALFSPDRGEAQAMTGEQTPDGALEKLLGWGASVVALRMGAEGSLVVTSTGARYRVPAVPRRSWMSRAAATPTSAAFWSALAKG